MNLPMIGSSEKTKTSKFQISLVDNSDKSLHPIDYPRINRFFDSKDDRNKFLELFEQTIRQRGGKLVHNDKLSHPSFRTFDIVDNYGNVTHDITVYL